MISKDPSETAGGEAHTRFGSYKQKEAFTVTGLPVRIPISPIALKALSATAKQ